MAGDRAFEAINGAKVNLDHIYDQPDPRTYFQELRKLDYAIPGEAKPIFQNLISCLRNRLNETVHVLDIGCSYGVNAALLKHDLTIGKLYEHWRCEGLADATPAELFEYDQHFFSDLDKAEDVEVVGLDRGTGIHPRIL